jgi:hypothetical protein
MSRPIVVWLLTVVTIASTSSVLAQERVRVNQPAPLFLLPDASRVPLQQATAGMFLEVIGAEGAWLNVSWNDARVGRRIGYIDSRFVTRLAAPTARPTPETPAVPATQAVSAPAVSPAVVPPDPPAVAPVRPATPAVTSLKQVRRLFIEPMENDLDQYISAEVVKELQGRITLVLNKESADAILRGVSENRTGVGAAITGRYLGLHDNASGSITLIDRDETVVLWASEAGDRSLMWGVMARGGQRKVADRLVNNLKKALNDAK